MLYRFREAMLIESGVKRHPKDMKSLNPATCTSVPIAEQNRRDLMKEIHRKIGRIQDKELELAVVRTLNDEINEAIERIKIWDEKIRELGGLSRRSQRRIEEFESAAIDGSSSSSSELVQFQGKYYFGRARELPEVEDLLKHRRAADEEGQELAKIRKHRAEMYAKVDHIYYGLLSEEQEKLILAEEAEIFGQVRRTEEPQMDEVDLLALKEGLNVPSQSQIQEYLLERRKAELIKKYT